MIRHFSDTGVTSFARIQPPDMYKWNLLTVFLVIHSSATAGTRTVSLYKTGFNNAFSFIIVDASGTTVSGSIYAQLLPVAGATHNLYPPFWLDSEDGIGMSFSLQTGDTVDYDIEVDEVLDGGK